MKPYPSKPLHSHIIWLSIYTVAFLTGLYSSATITHLLFGNEPDASHTLLLWQGVNTHGWAWLRDWLFTPDNWLLSLVPIHFLAFTVFGANPTVVITGGWVIMVTAAFTCGLIARQLGARLATFGVLLALLFLNVYSHARGFVSYSISHNITNLLGLLSVSLLLAWIRKPSLLPLLGLCLLLTVGAVSDPWMLAAYNLPIALTSLVFLHPRTCIVKRTETLKLLFAVTFSIIATKTCLFGLLDFIPSLHFHEGDWDTINNNASYLIRDLGGMLNVIPFHTHNAWLPALLSLLLVVGLLGFHGWQAMRIGYLALPWKEGVTFVWFCFFSLGGITLAFIITSVPSEDLSARFLINMVYLIPLLLSILFEYNWTRLSKTAKWLALSVSGLFLASGIISLLLTWENQGSDFEQRDIQGLHRYLEQQGLNYGYGSYWGSSANTITFESEGKIIIRPVTFKTNSGKVIFGNRFQSSRHWYTKEDIPAGQTTFFVIITPDGEDCNDVELCKRGVTQQFGIPIKTLAYGKSNILVWDHPLIGYHPPLTPIPVSLNKPVHFNQNYNHDNSMHGWAIAESWGIWSEEDTATLLLHMTDTPTGQDLILQLEGHAFVAEKHPTQQIEVSINDQVLANIQYNYQDNNGIRTITVPQTLWQISKQQLLLRFRIKDPQSPAELGMSTDGRKLGLGLVALTLTARP